MLNVFVAVHRQGDEMGPNVTHSKRPDRRVVGSIQDNAAWIQDS